MYFYDSIKELFFLNYLIFNFNLFKHFFLSTAYHKLFSDNSSFTFN